MATTINKKISAIFTLLEHLANGRELYSQDESLQEELLGSNGEASERALRRYLEDIHQLYGNIVLTEKKKKEMTDRKVTVYRVPDRKKDVSRVLKFFMENSDDLGWILQMINENDPSFLKELDTHDRTDIERSIQADEGIFVFKSSPFETFDNKEEKAIFSQLKKAVKNHEYRSFVYEKNKEMFFENFKCLKLVYMNHNWYLATEDEEGQFRWLRLSFIKEVKYASNGKVAFQPKRVERYGTFFSQLQNAMTLAGVPFQKTTLKAGLRIAIYFKEGMKPFFPSQKYIRTEEDGSVLFSVSYTQPLELLPFIKQWLPDLEIVSPVELKEVLVEDLKTSLQKHEK